MIHRFLDRLFGPRLRVMYRALGAGALVIYYADEPLSKGALAAAAWAALETLTPFNRTVGVGKQLSRNAGG